MDSSSLQIGIHLYVFVMTLCVGGMGYAVWMVWKDRHFLRSDIVPTAPLAYAFFTVFLVILGVALTFYFFNYTASPSHVVQEKEQWSFFSIVFIPFLTVLSGIIMYESCDSTWHILKHSHLFNLGERLSIYIQLIVSAFFLLLVQSWLWVMVLATDEVVSSRVVAYSEISFYSATILFLVVAPLYLYYKVFMKSHNSLFNFLMEFAGVVGAITLCVPVIMYAYEKILEFVKSL